MARRRVNTTKYEIIQLATKMILEEGYSATTPKAICDALDISTGNLTYYFPTKEHMLAVLVEMFCDFQGKLMAEEMAEGKSSLLAVCLELLSIAAACEQDENAKDFFLSAYRSTMCLELIRNHDRERAKEVFAPYCAGWDEARFQEAEILISGIEYATLATTDVSTSLENRIIGALNTILTIYNVPKELRQLKIEKALAMDYKKFGLRVLKKFREFVAQTNEHNLEGC